ncbi:unnamed protein product [Orchesella dallaii]|uniref:F-box domain-containing protein n=1 Tax=Orchesella dallaii TaxID=48710 RepID=A0ABP1S0K2_9HEXA
MTFPQPDAYDIWMYIFELLGDEDKINFANSSSILHGWVERKLTPLLFAKEAPLLRGYAPLETLMGIRQVSSKCRQSIDADLSSHHSNIWLEFESAAHENKNIAPIQTVFRSSIAIQTFLAEMADESQNPFPSRSVSFVLKDGWDFALTSYGIARVEGRFWETCIDLLQRYGEHILYIEFRCVFGPIMYAATAAKLMRSLSLVPNIKSLVIQGSIDGTERFVKEYFLNNPPPRLLNLETIRMRRMGEIMTENVLRYCCVPANIKRVSIAGFNRQSLPDEIYGFCNLEMLEASVNNRSLERLGESGNVPPLREYHGGEPLSWRSIESNNPMLFRSLRAFSSSLYKIRIAGSFNAAFSQLVSPGAQLCFPNLRILSFESYSGSLDFLVQFAKISRLEFDQHPSQGVMVGLVVLDGYQVKKSNLWSLLPELKNIVLSGRTYWRAQEQRGSELEARGDECWDIW